MSPGAAKPSPVLFAALRTAVFIICTGGLVMPFLWSDRSSPAFVINSLSIGFGIIMLMIVAVLIRRPVIPREERK